MPTRNVVLTDHHEKVIEELVRSGRYQNASEVLREGIRLIEKREAAEKAKLEALRAAVTLGATQIDNGEYLEFDEQGLSDFFDSIEAEIDRPVTAPVR
ncbi:addiction module antidote protein [Niveispirillum lacus]|uniref:Addiction module antidote protein n=1 Tax=Niveispirillum lacus TaxID=1981099 RepID=A0A255YXT2_9PROT|nr:type II toxin-antitoxin system ParD family antitoxin [Niveispirillum lacus]OYQ33504.1 addiction module antidote protein [Niveispirillum lacus]